MENGNPMWLIVLPSRSRSKRWNTPVCIDLWLSAPGDRGDLDAQVGVGEPRLDAGARGRPFGSIQAS